MKNAHSKEHSNGRDTTSPSASDLVGKAHLSFVTRYGKMGQLKEIYFCQYAVVPQASRIRRFHFF